MTHVNIFDCCTWFVRNRFFSPALWCSLLVSPQVTTQPEGMNLMAGYCLDPNSCSLAYVTALFGPIGCQQLLIDDYAIESIFVSWGQINVQGCILQPNVFWYHICPACHYQIFEPRVQLVGFVFGTSSLLYTTEATNVQTSNVLIGQTLNLSFINLKTLPLASQIAKSEFGGAGTGDTWPNSCPASRSLFTFVLFFLYDFK